MEEELQRKNAEIVQLYQQLAQKDKDLAQKDKDHCVAAILERALPPLGTGPLKSSMSVTQCKTVEFTLNQAIDDVPILDNLPTDRTLPSSCWLQCNGRHWVSEAAVRECAKMALTDCLQATKLRDAVMIQPEISFPSVNTTKVDRTDLAVVKLGQVRAVTGAVEVKKPPVTGQESFDMDHVQQIVQYMYDLRVCHGVRFVFGILTTYTEWRVLWLEDSDEAIKATSVKDYLTMCGTSPPVSPNDDTVTPGDVRLAEVPEMLVVHKSKIYHYNDPELVSVLRTVLFKWAFTPCDNVGGFLQKRRRYQFCQFDKDEVKFEKLNQVKQLSYQFPFPKQTNGLYFLRVYKRSGDGKVALFCTSSGKVGVAKFFIPYDGDDDDDAQMKIKANKEADLWQEIWQVEYKGNHRVVSMAKRWVLLMPFVFHARNYNGQVIFCPLSSWNHRSGEDDWKKTFYDPQTVTEDRNLANTGLLKLIENPMEVARQALTHMIVHSKWQQPDSEVVWEHIGVMPSSDGNSVKAVVIDLTRVFKVQNGDEQVVLERHLKRLKNLMRTVI